MNPSESYQTWFSSDHHFGHANIINYCNRPFASVWEMDEALIYNHNKVVSPNDLVYFLGDFTFYKDAGQVNEILHKMNGRKTLVMGNHDEDFHFDLSGWAFVHFRHEEVEFLTSKFPCTLNHFPMLSWNQSHRGAFHLHGHTHGGLPFDPTIRRIDVGVDCWDYTPVNAQTLWDKLSKVPIEKKRYEKPT